MMNNLVDCSLKIMLESQTLETTTELDEFGDVNSVDLETSRLELFDEVFSFVMDDSVFSDDSGIASEFLGILVGQVENFTAEFLDLLLGSFRESVFVDSNQVFANWVHGGIQVVEFGINEFESDDFHVGVDRLEIRNDFFGVSLAITDEDFTIPDHGFTGTFVMHAFRNSFTLNANGAEIFDDVFGFGETFISGESTENSFLVDGENGITEEAQFSQTFLGDDDIHGFRHEFLVGIDEFFPLLFRLFN